MSMLRDENIDLRERMVDVETDYATLADSYRTFITVSKYKTKQIGMTNFTQKNTIVSRIDNTMP